MPLRAAAGVLSGICQFALRAIRPLVAAGTAAGLLAACSPSATAPTAGGPAAGPITASAPVSGEVIGGGQVKVAMLLPLSATGNAGQLAATMKNAAALALQEFQGNNIQILVKDDRGTPEGARAAATEAINQGAELILGPLFAQSVSAAAEIARPAGVPVVAFSTDIGAASRGVYLLGFLPQSDIDRVVQYAASKGKRSYAALLPANAYGNVAEAALQKAVGTYGGQIVAIERYNLDRVDMQAKAESIAPVIKAGQADAVVMPDAGDAAPFMAQVLAAQKLPLASIKFLGSGQWDDKRVATESMLNGGWYSAPDKSGFESFSQRYQAAYGQAPQRAASLGYDAASLAAGLASRFGAQRFRQETLTNSSGFVGVDGVFRLLPDGTNQRGLAIYEIGGGKAQVVEPAPTTFARAQL